MYIISTLSFIFFNKFSNDVLFNSTFSFKWVFSIFLLIISIALLFFSQSITFLAPRLAASNPIAPLPENYIK